MKINQTSPEVLSSVPEIVGHRISVIKNAVYTMQAAAEAMGVEEYSQPKYQNYVNPSPQKFVPAESRTISEASQEELRTGIDQAYQAGEAAKDHTQPAVIEAEVIKMADYRLKNKDIYASIAAAYDQEVTQ